MAHFSISKEFGLHNKKIYQDLAQKKLKSLDDLLNSSSSDDEEEEEEEDEDEDEENGNQDRDGNEEKNDEKTVCQRDEESGQLLEVFTYGAIHDPDCPQELSQIFLTPGKKHQVCRLLILFRGYISSMSTKFTPLLVSSDEFTTTSLYCISPISDSMH